MAAHDIYDKSLRPAKQLTKQGKIDDANAVYIKALEQFPSNKRIQQAQRALQLSLKSGRQAKRVYWKNGAMGVFGRFVSLM